MLYSLGEAVCSFSVNTWLTHQCLFAWGETFHCCAPLGFSLACGFIDFTKAHIFR
uniref:Uncharacterized protein n=1 Tax=Anguilla anguilla TaxID=7936 RepID=A0A0E9RBQ0_ANGAN